MTNRNVKSGFTLIELLVVIAIIAILAAILFPVFARAREKARQTTCTSNQRQIAASTQMYAQDHDETYPAATSFWSAIKVDPGVVICPTLGKNTPNGYVFNNNYSETASGTITDPTVATIIADGSHKSTVANIATQVDGTAENVAYEYGDFDARHSKMLIRAYADGHVATTPAPVWDISGLPGINGLQLYYPGSADVNLAHWPGVTSTGSNSGATAFYTKFKSDGQYWQGDNPANQNYFTMTLPASQYIYKVRLRKYPGQESTAYKISVGDDLNNLNAVVNVSGEPSSMSIVEKTFAPTLGKYIRYQVLAGVSTTYSALSDFSFYSMDPKLVNSTYSISETKSGKVTITPVTGTWANWSYRSRQTIENLFSEYEGHDWDDPAPDCRTMVSGATGSVKISLPNFYNASGYRLDGWGAQLDPTNILFEGSTDDKTYTTLLNFANASRADQLNGTWTPTRVKYIKITFTNSTCNFDGNNLESLFYRCDLYGLPTL